MIQLRGMSNCNERLRFRRPHEEGRRARGFTLIELVVTIAIIVLLVSLLVYASVALIRRSEVTRTQNTLDLLKQAMQQWELTAGRQITFGPIDPAQVPPYYDVDEQTMVGAAPPAPPGVFTQVDDVTRKMLAIIERTPEVKEFIARIEADRVKRDPLPANWLTIRDAWDTPIMAIHPGREWIAGLPGPDDDDTWRVPFENVYGIAQHRIILFVSAGPDGNFGSLAPSATQTLKDFAKDNVYSYEPGKP